MFSFFYFSFDTKRILKMQNML